MSKRDDDSASDMDVGMTTAERRRRRRRGGGLRVPSDNVPRRANPPVVAPVPEDPSLAMSIAYSFGSDSADSIARVDVHDGRRPITSTDERGGFDPEAPEAIPTVIDPPIGAGETQDFEMKTREMTAVDLEALGLQEPGSDGSPAASNPNLPGIEVRFKPQRPERESESDAIPQERAASVEVDMEGLEGISTLDTELPEPDGDDAPEIVVTAEPVAVPVPEPQQPRKQRERLKTVALTDEDLEEVREAVRAASLPPVVEPVVAPVPASTSGPISVLSDQARAELERVQRQLDPAPKKSSQPIAPIQVPPAEDDAADSAADLAINRTMPLVAVDIEVDRAEIESKSRSRSPRSTSRSSPIARRPRASTRSTSTTRTSSAVAAPPTPAVEPRRERAPSAPPPLAPAPASTTPGVGLGPQPPAPIQHAQPPAPPPAALAHPKTPPTPPPPKKQEAKASPPAATRTTTTDGKIAPRGKPWFVDLFDEDYLRTLPFLTPQATQAEAEFVINAMGLTPGAQVLDVGCGYGRHAMELAARGFHVVGLDLSTPLLVRGGEESQRRGLQINFVRGDMRELDFEAQFDAAYCLFSTFGYFDDETNKKTIANIARALKPGGRVLIEILNRDYLITDLPTRVWWEGDGCVVLEEVELNYFSSRIQVNRSVVFDDGRQLEQEISVRAYSLHEVGKLMHAAGFRVLEVSGGYHTRSRFFGNQSRHIIVLAERKETPPA
ncbi:MAG: methyltransferase domain-containing protein [Kofleriaceae bacterium]